MEITTELIQSIYTRAILFANARFGCEPDEIRINEEGNIVAVYITHHSGEREEDINIISPTDLTIDLEFAAQRFAIELEEKRKAEAEAELERKRVQAERDKKQRYIQYVTLKREFENNA